MNGSERSWVAKFADSIRGLGTACRLDISIRVQLLFAILAVGVAAVLRLSAVEWCLVVISISTVTAAEYFNTALEQLAKATTSEHNAFVGRCLDVSAAAVLISAFGAAAVGVILFAPKIVALL